MLTCCDIFHIFRAVRQPVLTGCAPGWVLPAVTGRGVCADTSQPASGPVSTVASLARTLGQVLKDDHHISYTLHRHFAWIQWSEFGSEVFLPMLKEDLFTGALESFLASFSVKQATFCLDIFMYHI